MTLLGSGLLLVCGTLAALAYEWINPATFGPLGPADKLLGAAFHAVQTRTAGLNASGIGMMERQTLAVSYGSMMIGGSSAGTAGGIKVTTLLVLSLVI